MLSVCFSHCDSPRLTDRCGLKSLSELVSPSNRRRCDASLISTHVYCRPDFGWSGFASPGATCHGSADRARPGSKHHLITEAQGIPLAVILTGANRNDVTQLLPLVAAIPPIRGLPGRPLSKPRIIQADRGYDHDKYRRPLHAQGIRTLIARRNTLHGSGLGACARR